MESGGDGVQAGKEASYTIISFKGSELPKQYYNMVLSKWMRTLRYGADYYKLIYPDAYFTVYSKFIKIILSKPNVIVKLAVLSDDKDVTLGWSVYEDSALHYVWVHGDQRNQGIATSLLPKNIDFITHLTNSGIRFWHKRFPTAKFNPFYV